MTDLLKGSPFCSQRERYDCPFWYVLKSNASERTYAAAKLVCVEPCKALAKKNTYSHTFRNIVQSNSKYKHGNPLQIRPRSLWKLLIKVEVEGSHCQEKAEKKMPNKKPTAAGSQANLPNCSDISIEGRSKDQTDAAIITPAETLRESSEEMVWVLFH